MQGTNLYAKGTRNAISVLAAVVEGHCKLMLAPQIAT
jgi:fructose-1,6-bisphosphatase/sedoheptulose 1,7-bisphosphatase-like protein